MASDISLRTILIVWKETRCRLIGYSYRLTARVLLYAPSHRQDNTYHGLCYTSRGTLAGTRNSSMGPPHEGSIRWPIAPWANALPLSYVPLLHGERERERERERVTQKSYRVNKLLDYIYAYTHTARERYVRSWCDGSSDRFLVVNPLSYFSFQPVFDGWYNKGRGMCYSVQKSEDFKEFKM